ncbi:hypothetical protein ACVWYG_002571 [Pedobacter sp. UYEF25]
MKGFTIGSQTAKRIINNRADGGVLRNIQIRISKWMLICFNEKIAYDIDERSHRFLEEALELCQSVGTTKEEAILLVDYVFNRPTGETYQEVGGVMVTLGALCNAVGKNMEDCALTEIERIESPEVMERIRVKQQSKPPSSPLPQ